jgi:hypothetical protein
VPRMELIAERDQLQRWSATACPATMLMMSHWPGARWKRFPARGRRFEVGRDPRAAVSSQAWECHSQQNCETTECLAIVCSQRVGTWCASKQRRC